MAGKDAFNVPMHLSDFSVIDSEFNSIRERFDAEMRKMEDEMNRFRSELLNRESSSSLMHKSSTTQSASSSMDHGAGAASPLPGGQHRSEVRTWLDGLDSPLIKEGQESDGKCLSLRFDVSQYKPEEIVVKTVDQKLQVHAKHEEKSDTRSVYREYNREFLLPKGTNPELIRSTLSKDGVLTVEAPLPQPAITAGERAVPVDHK